MSSETRTAQQHPGNHRNRALGPGLGQAQRMGSGVGGLHKDEHESVDNGVLPRKFIELVGVAMNAACTNLNPEAPAATSAPHSRRERRATKFCSSSNGVGHVDPFVQPRRADSARGSEGGRREARHETSGTTPACDKMKAIGQWNPAWDPFVELDPVWTDQFMATGGGIYASGVMPPKEIELSASPSMPPTPTCTRPARAVTSKAHSRPARHMEEIMEVLKLCVVQGVQACNLGVPILAEELARSEMASTVASRGEISRCLVPAFGGAD